MSVLSAPERPVSLKNSAQWLAGEGAGSWFVVDILSETNAKVHRYSPDGALECTGQFISEDQIDPALEYTITYPSHCQVVTVIQNKAKIKLNRIESDR